MFEEPEAADRHAGAASAYAERETLRVYDSYAAVPRELRYRDPGGGISQLIGLRDP
jgi:hypothetical protein